MYDYIFRAWKPMLMYIFSSQMAVFEDGPYRNGVFEAPKGEIKSSITVLGDMFWPQGIPSFVSNCLAGST